MTLRSVILGTGHYLPKKRMTNADLMSLVDTNDEWIVERTGIRARHIASEGETTSILAIEAAKAAIADAKIDANSIDLIVLATATPDYTFPSTATQVQAALGITGGAAFDVQAVCSGFVYALTTADNFLKTGSAKRALVIGAETFSRILDWTDRTTCVLFGDGAGAVILDAQEGGGTNADHGILCTHLRSDGRHLDKLYVDGGPSTTMTTGHLRMEGKEVFRHAVVNLAETVDEALHRSGLAASEISWFVPHQANRRIIDATAKKLGIDPSKVVITVDQHGNTSAASIPLALSVARHDGRIKQGELVLIEAMGGGFTWGSALIRW
ncbi:MAG: beta-ketoacyl-ACP synthase III [Hyphomicrobiales bacterium]